jgi:hypothetical protein
MAEVRGTAEVAEEVESHAADASFFEVAQVLVCLAAVEQRHASIAVLAPFEGIHVEHS